MTVVPAKAAKMNTSANSVLYSIPFIECTTRLKVISPPLKTNDSRKETQSAVGLFCVGRRV
jgi:hypothetical protein